MPNTTYKPEEESYCLECSCWVSDWVWDTEEDCCNDCADTHNRRTLTTSMEDKT